MNWLAARTRSRHEKFVQVQLTAQGIEACVPTVIERPRWGPRLGRVESVIISGYCFVADGSRREVLQCVGVCGFVSFGGIPATIPQEEIDMLKAACDPKFRAKEHYGFQKRDAVRISGTAFDGLIGTVDMMQSDRVRIILPMSGIGRCISVEVPLENVEPLPTQSSIPPLLIEIPIGVH